MKNPFPNPANQILDRISHSTVDTAVFRLSKEYEPIGSVNRRGGVLTVLMVNTKAKLSFFAATSVGHPPSQKIAVYGKNASEKVARLRARRFEGNDDVVSSTSANSELGTYGGGVFFTNSNAEEIYISFSGAPPEVDEAIAFVIGEKLGFTVPVYDNPLIPRARELLEGVV